MDKKKIKSALISVYYKDGLEPLVKNLHSNGVKIYSTGGTKSFIEELGVPVTAVEDVTSYPSILGGRVKTLHPKVFGGILFRRENTGDQAQVKEYEIPEIDLVIVDLYPFEETLASGAAEDDIIEKIDIGGISLIRAAAKNYNDVVIIASKDHYPVLQSILEEKAGSTEIEDRRLFATHAFDITSHYDSAIFNWFNKGGEVNSLKISNRNANGLRYGENPHQKGTFYGKLDEMFDQLNGKELSYNNLVDVDAAVSIASEFKEETFFAILKHTNACGAATGASVKEAYVKAFKADPVSAFGGVLITNKEVNKEAADEMNSLFFEILVAPSYTSDALQVLKSKKNRIILQQKQNKTTVKEFKSLLNGVIEQDRDLKADNKSEFKQVTERSVTTEEAKALEFASKICKHTKSNTIVIAVDGQLLASGTGQTSRVDALKQAIEKSGTFGFSLQGAVMASDAFFPFPDCVQIASKAGITAVVQPGGSVKDQDSIDEANKNNMAMVFTGTRHFKH